METEIIISKEFEQQIPPLTEEEFETLEQNILADGRIINPLILWNGTLVDGHNRYRILQKHPEIPYTVFEKAFSDKYEVIAWICKNQLGRRNLTNEQRKYLLGKRYEAEKLTQGAPDGNKNRAFQCYQNDNIENMKRTCERIARDVGVGSATVIRAEKYAAGVDAAEEVLPGIRQDILSGTIKPVEKEVAAIATAPQEERLELVEQLRKPKTKSRVTETDFQQEAEPYFLPDAGTLEDAFEDGEEGNSEEDNPSAITAKTRRTPSPISTAAILKISEGMLHSEGNASGTKSDMIDEMSDALSSMIWRWNNCKEVYQAVLKKRENRKEITELADEGIEYFKKIKKGELWK